MPENLSGLQRIGPDRSQNAPRRLAQTALEHTKHFFFQKRYLPRHPIRSTPQATVQPGVKRFLLLFFKKEALRGRLSRPFLKKKDQKTSMTWLRGCLRRAARAGCGDVGVQGSLHQGDRVRRGARGGVTKWQLSGKLADRKHPHR